MPRLVKSILISTILFIVFAPCAFGVWYYIFIDCLNDVWGNLSPQYNDLLGYGLMIFAVVSSIVLYFITLRSILILTGAVDRKELKKYVLISGVVTLALAFIALKLYLDSLVFMW